MNRQINTFSQVYNGYNAKHQMFLKYLLALVFCLLFWGVQAFAGTQYSSKQVSHKTIDGTIIDSLEAFNGWCQYSSPGVVCTLLCVDNGYKGKALALKYDLDSINGAWTQLKKYYNPPIDLSACDHIRFYYRSSKKNSLQMGFISNNDTCYFSSTWKNVYTFGTTILDSNYTYATWDYKDFNDSNGIQLSRFDSIEAIFISVIYDDSTNDDGGQGLLFIDELQNLKFTSQTDSVSADTVVCDTSVTNKAASYIALQQKNDGLLKSWKEESEAKAYLFDQALGLLVLADTSNKALRDSNMPVAQKLAHKIIALQNTDGSWYSGYYYDDDQPHDYKKPTGAISWVVFALKRYFSHDPDETDADSAAHKGADWLCALQRPDGSLPGEIEEDSSSVNDAQTEANLDAWWALYTTGHFLEADRLKEFILDSLWDDGIGRFKADKNVYRIYLDNQTWGAAFLDTIGRHSDARRALSYALNNLATYSNDTIAGLCACGPFGVWNEGTLQYIAAYGDSSKYFWSNMVKQKSEDGGMPASPDNFSGYDVWFTKMHGIAATSWLYFAGKGGPFKDPDGVAMNYYNKMPGITHFLGKNHPNPMRTSTEISYSLQEDNFVSLKMYDILGREVKTLVNKKQKAGTYKVKIGAYGLSCGIYFYKLKVGGDFEKIRKMLLIR